jgi:hypothetical protein
MVTQVLKGAWPVHTVEQLGQEPSIEEQVAAVRARHDAEAEREITTIAPSTPAPELAPDQGIPIHDQRGRVIGFQLPPPTATINMADNSVVNAPPTLQQPADPVLVELLRTMPTSGTMTEDDD